MAADINDKFAESTTNDRPAAAALTAIKTSGATSVTVDSTTGWPTASAVHFTMYEVDADGAKITSTQRDYKGIVNSATSINNVTIRGGADREFPIGAKVICAPTAAWADDLAAGLVVEHNQDGTHALALFNKIYPVGSIYTNASNSTNPGTLLGFGTWVAFGAGKVMVGLDSGDTDFDTAEETGGAKTHTHNLSSDGWAQITNSASGGVSEKLVTGITSWTPNRATNWTGGTGGSTTAKTEGAELAGATDSGSTIQPYIVVYMWKRTA